MRKQIPVLRSIAMLFFVVTTLAFAADAAAQYSYYPLTPCRVVDTRNATGTNGGPALGSGVTRNFAIKGSCGIPSTAKAVSMNVAVTQASAGGFLSIWPSGSSRPLVASINFVAGDTLANGAIVGLSSAAQDLSVYNVSGTVHVIIDVSGYFQ
jgi:hypothetical protein